MDETGRSHGRNMKIHAKPWSKYVRGTDQLEDLNVGGGVTLKLILNKQ